MNSNNIDDEIALMQRIIATQNLQTELMISTYKTLRLIALFIGLIVWLGGCTLVDIYIF
jgi:hypothetical protein